MLVLLVLTLIILAVLVGARVSPFDPTRQDLGNRLQSPLSIDHNGKRHLLGTDQLGRDVLSRTLVGTRVSLLLAFTGVLASALIGVGVGLASGFYGGCLDHVLMALVDTQLALPFVLIAISIGAVTGPSVGNVLIVLVATGWVPYARVVRAQVLSLRSTDFVLAARGLGSSPLRVAVRSILPNCLSPVIVISSFAAAHMIIAEATVSFLGVGVPSWIPSWGSMISEGRSYLMVAWWVVLVPSGAITVTVVAVNLLGDWLRDGWDPRQRVLVRSLSSGQSDAEEAAFDALTGGSSNI